MVTLLNEAFNLFTTKMGSQTFEFFEGNVISKHALLKRETCLIPPEIAPKRLPRAVLALHHNVETTSHGINSFERKKLKPLLPNVLPAHVIRNTP